MIRDAQQSDLKRIVEMGARFRRETSYDKYLGESRDCMTKLAENLISKRGLLLSERGGRIIGMLGFIVHTHFISGELIAGEVFWWVEPEHRGEGVKLLAEMKRRGKLAGAKYYQMVAPNEKVARFYERCGCEFVEATYQGAL